jgi:membrane protease YdiL (CAAX protease family)
MSARAAERPSIGLAPAAWQASGVLGLVAAQALGQPQAVALLVIAPLAEEIVFRLGLQEALLRRGLAPLAANVLTAVAFALAHLPAHSWVWSMLTFAPALALGALYARKRQLAPCVVLHAAMNGVWLAWQP